MQSSCIPILYLCLLYPAYILATPIPTKDTSTQVLSSIPAQSPTSHKPPAEIQFLVELTLWTPSQDYNHVTNDLAGKVRDTAEILLPPFLPILRHMKHKEPFGSHPFMVFHVTKMTYSGPQTEIDPLGKDHYRLDVRLKTMENVHIGDNDHTLYFLQSVFDEAPTPIGQEHATRLQGEGDAEGVELNLINTGRPSFVTFENGFLYHGLQPKDRITLADVGLSWARNQDPITQTEIDGEIVFSFVKTKIGWRKKVVQKLSSGAQKVAGWVGQLAKAGRSS
ncbi:hypothetical protein EV361DRAFT_550391 [Lentinula raphanica]|uniref:Uncharacterized protein n=1 Tax=Lentinula raphanica TaxID=153919 RepID=A0AA38P3R9_9AGAR|nr:hypothetical protein F5878DRAFT_296459 [Lentinula raphanica]KAJ3975147.1 hypothetical protein EV361DRAFT_550391 [Lentinula raphanica]